ncbi:MULTISPECIES: phage tail tube protein [unclassified Sulfitobacter]|uniref:phage tail tube protein n=1 Tax=unclassified Sulfitobacter TaxID=196795 RepID=UPI0007C287E5|nr:MULTISPECIES: phage tail tube protein [unclassified Sulfitobacter]KZX90392.1 hypothetical protein A3720_10425 [Sulfitobacter sp. HI0021]KZY04218.1 hypothetical protein A3722_19525 [Sulfitobacter sp. HI0027]KZZ01835.1 hypothetical protein A3747_17895 [Sulfitobacter sp. HI0076]
MDLTVPVYGSVVEWSPTGQEDWTRIPKAKNVVIPEVTKDFRDVTTLDSPGGFREWAKGLKDGGELTLETIYSAAGYETAAEMEALPNGAFFRVTLPAQTGQLAGDQFAWKGHVTPTIPSETVDGDIMLNLGIRTTGDVAWTKGEVAP